MIEGLACGWPTGSMGSRESPADVGVSRWTDRAGQQAAPAWSEHGLQNSTTRHGYMCFQLGGAHQFRRPLAGLWWTFQVPSGMVPMTARGQKVPLAAQPC